MSDEFQYDIFISYSNADAARVRPVAERLRAEGLRVWFDEWAIVPGDDIFFAIERALETSRRLLLCLSRAALASKWVEMEHRTVLFRDPSSRNRVLIPLLLEDCELPAALRRLAYADFRHPTEAAFQQLFRVCRSEGTGETVEGPPPGNGGTHTGNIPDPAGDIEGIVPVEQIHASPHRLPGEVFAIELLQKPIEIIRQWNGRFLIIIDRRGVRHAAITTRAKNEMCKQYTAGREDEIRRYDKAIHDFLLGRSPGDQFTVDLPRWRIPLRWASGGVMSVVTRADAPHEKWTPLFFRDINPWGWNVALGSCERNFDEHWTCRTPVEEELQDPRRFLFREFLEETLILSNRPQLGSPVWFKRFYLDDTLADRQLEKSAAFAKEHLRHRSQDDHIEIREESGQGPGITPNSVRVYNDIVRMDTRIIDPQGNCSDHFGFMVAFNLLELGIEVVRVFEYEVRPDDYFLDGELLVHPDGSTELVRMPVALISHTALRRLLGSRSYEPVFTEDKPPSIVTGPIDEETEIRVFEWDVQQRLKRMGSSGTPEREKRRYEQWFNRFGSRLFTEGGRYKCANDPQVFTPAAAKILSLFFAQTS
jgi:hypothetical protein